MQAGTREHARTVSGEPQSVQPPVLHIHWHVPGRQERCWSGPTHHGHFDISSGLPYPSCCPEFRSSSSCCVSLEVLSSGGTEPLPQCRSEVTPRWKTSRAVGNPGGRSCFGLISQGRLKPTGIGWVGFDPDGKVNSKAGTLIFFF